MSLVGPSNYVHIYMIYHFVTVKTRQLTVTGFSAKVTPEEIEFDASF